MYSKFEALLKEHNLSAYKVSKDTSISQSTLSDWKNGKSCPKIDKIIILSKYFSVPVEYFLS